MDIRVNNILSEIANQYGITPLDIRGDSREANIALARHHAIYRVKNELNFTLKKTGKVFNRSHPTIMNSINKYLEHQDGNDVNYSNEEEKFITSLVAEKHRLWHKMKDVDSLLKLYQK